MIPKIFCDICYSEIEPFRAETLLSSYATKDIEHICPSCSDDVNKQLIKLRCACHGWYVRMLKIWMRNKRKSYTKPPEEK